MASQSEGGSFPDLAMPNLKSISWKRTYRVRFELQISCLCQTDLVSVFLTFGIEGRKQMLFGS